MIALLLLLLMVWQHFYPWQHTGDDRHNNHGFFLSWLLFDTNNSNSDSDSAASIPTAAATRQQQQQQQQGASSWNGIRSSSKSSSSSSSQSPQQPLQQQQSHTHSNNQQLLHRHNKNSNNSNTNTNKLVHTGSFGLGHRLSKLSAAVHLAASLPHLPVVEVQWGTCGTGSGSGSGTGGAEDSNAAAAGQTNNRHDDTDIFRHLFGTSTLHLRTDNNESNDDDNEDYHQGKVVWVRNDVAGYYAAQSYKNAAAAAAATSAATTSTAPLLRLSRASAVAAYTHKLESDHALFVDLFERRFLSQSSLLKSATASHQQQQQQFQRVKDMFRDHFVIGIHVRAGNGEQDHFAAANRGSVLRYYQQDHSENQNTTTTTTTTNAAVGVVESMAQLIQQLWSAVQLEQQKQQQQSGTAAAAADAFVLKPPLVFVATDTVAYIDQLRDALVRLAVVGGTNGPSSPIPVISWEQPRVEPGKGVSYQEQPAWVKRTTTSTTPLAANDAHAEGNRTASTAAAACLAGWVAAATDMALLASSDVLIAAARSTFTQIAPASLVFGRDKTETETTTSPWRYCEMDLTGAVASADSNYNYSRMTCFASQAVWLFRQPVSAFRTFSVNADHGDSATAKNNEAVAHKVMVHLPDITAATSDPIFTATRDFLTSSEPLLPNETVFYYGKKYNPKYRRKLPFSKEWTWIEDGEQ